MSVLMTVMIEPPPISVAISSEVLIGAGLILVAVGIVAAVKEQETRIVR